MTQYDIELLAQFAATWPLLNHDPARRSALRVDLCRFFEDHDLEFNREVYWDMLDRIDTSDREQRIKR